jgi:hypothetical protein
MSEHSQDNFNKIPTWIFQWQNLGLHNVESWCFLEVKMLTGLSQGHSHQIRNWTSV